MVSEPVLDPFRSKEVLSLLSTSAVLRHIFLPICPISSVVFSVISSVHKRRISGVHVSMGIKTSTGINLLILFRTLLLVAAQIVLGDESKNAHLRKLENASENLQLFKADVLDYNSVALALAGCEGVFHVASPVPASKVLNPEEEILKPAVDGTLNVLKACAEAKVRRAVVVSSCATVLANPNWPKGKTIDEDCWSDKDYFRKTEKWYSLSKLLAESAALDFGEKNGLDVVTVCPCWIMGPMLQSTVNATSSFFINLLKGASETVENKARHIVDVRDVASALLLAYEKPEASGRYLCVSHRIKTRDLIDMVKRMYPDHKYQTNIVEVDDDEATIGSEKLQKLGWKFRPLEETLRDSLECYKAAGLLE